MLMSMFMQPGADPFDVMESFLEVMRPPEWHSRAACRGMGNKVFFSLKPNAAANAICAGCPVARQCLADALAHGDVGTWGGTHNADRTALKRAAAA